MKRPPPIPRIYTLTGNLLWEQTLEFADWAPGRTQRAQSGTFQVGGKGINVSKMLTRLGTPSTALCFAGGHSGAAGVAWLKAHGFAFRSFATRRATRTGLVVRGGRRAETVFLGPDAPPGAAAVRRCAAYLDGQPDGGVLAICGSLPGWATADFDPLRAALERWNARGLLVVDTYGPPLAWLAARPVALVKINRQEFEDLRRGRRWPVRAWVVTDGGGPVSVTDERGRVTRLQPPRVREISPTGSGDVLLACMLHARLRRGLGWRAAAAFALPYAAANAADQGIATFPDPPAK